MACVRRGWVAVSQLRGADAPARRTLAPRHVAHREPPGHLDRSGTAGQPRRFRLSRRTPLWVRSRATRARLVPAIRSGLGRHSAVRPEQNRRQRPVRGYSYASQPPAVRSEGRWKHLSVRNVFLELDMQSGMQAFFSGDIKVDGDVSKLMALQSYEPSDKQKALIEEINGIS